MSKYYLMLVRKKKTLKLGIKGELLLIGRGGYQDGVKQKGSRLLLAHTLELPYLDNIPCKSAIPDGKYPLIYREFGKYHRIYKKRWGHKFVIEIGNVPNRSAILIHTGNTLSNTKGCILVGKRPNGRKNEFVVVNSRLIYQAYYDIVADAKPDFLVINDKTELRHEAKQA